MMFRAVPRLLAALLLLSLCPAGVFAADADGDYPPPWPDTDITITLPFPQTSELDALFSLIRDAVAAQTGKKAVPRHSTGRAGADAWARIVDDAPDGSVLTLVTFPDAYLRSTQPDSGVALDAMALCNVIAFMPCVLWTAAPYAFDSVQDVAEHAADKPGGFLVAGSGRYSATQIATYALNRELGIRTTYVPYMGTVPAVRAVLNNQARVFWGYSVRVAAPFIKDAALTPLAVAANKRLPSLPDVPTFQELGMRIYEGVYIAVAVPVGTPEITREEIAEFFSNLAATPEFQTKAAALGFSPVNIDAEAMPVFLTEMKAEADRQSESFSISEQ